MSLLRKKRKKMWRESRTFKSNKRLFARKKNNLVKNLKVAVVIGLVFFVVYSLFFSQSFLIKEIKVSGNKSINSENIENIVVTEISDMKFGFIPGNNFLFDKNEKVKTKLAKEFSEIKFVEVKKIFPNGLEIKITEKEPTVIWCRLDNCYYIDNNGVVFMCADNNLKTDNGKRIVKIIEEEIIKEEELTEEKLEKEKLTEEELVAELVKDEEEVKNKGETEKEEEEKNEEGTKKEGEVKNSPHDKGGLGGGALNPIEINDKVSDSDFINFALNIDREIKRNTQLKIKFYKTKGTKTRELIAYTDKNIRLYFNAMESVGLQVKYLKNLLLKEISKDEIDGLEYIYLESGNRIFYK